MIKLIVGAKGSGKTKTMIDMIDKEKWSIMGTDIKGQIYIPSVNSILWIGCILMILYFRNSSHMEAAYGFSITIAMMMTTDKSSYCNLS